MNTEQSAAFTKCSHIKFTVDELQYLILNLDITDQEGVLLYNTAVKKIKLLAKQLNEVQVED